MRPKKKGSNQTRHRANLRWILIALVLAVLVLSILAFISPISEGGQRATPTLTEIFIIETGTLEGDTELNQTAEIDAQPPTPEEIGYTDGIIFMSTLLVLILLVGTLRETLRRKGR